MYSVEEARRDGRREPPVPLQAIFAESGLLASFRPKPWESPDLKVLIKTASEKKQWHTQTNIPSRRPRCFLTAGLM